MWAAANFKLIENLNHTWLHSSSSQLLLCTLACFVKGNYTQLTNSWRQGSYSPGEKCTSDTTLYKVCFSVTQLLFRTDWISTENTIQLIYLRTFRSGLGPNCWTDLLTWGQSQLPSPKLCSCWCKRKAAARSWIHSDTVYHTVSAILGAFEVTKQAGVERILLISESVSQIAILLIFLYDEIGTTTPGR